MLRIRHVLIRLFKNFKSSVAFFEPNVERERIGYEANPLNDSFGRQHTYLRISLTERCNLRCKYCMPEDGLNLSHQSQLLTTNEILLLGDVFVKQGIRKIRLTGGEPTIRKDLLEIVRGLKELKGLTEGISITTNGLMLTKQLVELQRAGLNGINISLDTLKAKRYEEITRRKGWERVIAGIDLAVQLGYEPVKINCVVIKGFNEDEILDFVEMTKDKNVDVRFIEYMPFDGNRWSGEKFVPYDQMLSKISERYPDIVKMRDGPNDTSKAYKVPNYEGKIGFITSMSEHFCGSCNRLRLTADGNLKVCLFGQTEISLRDALRSGCGPDDLAALIAAAVRRKKKQHAVTKTKITNSLFSDKISRSNPLATMLAMESHLIARSYSTEKQLTHTDTSGKAKMIDIEGKSPTRRAATATAAIRVGSEIIQLIKQNSLKKGDVLSVSRVAGIMAAKRTSELIPLCHNIQLNHIEIDTELEDETVIIHATVKCKGKTGVEMEALTAASIAALTVYDMCKAVTHDMTFDVKLVKKTGGSRGNFIRDSA